VALHATVVSPDTPGPHPAMVMLPGAGPVKRAELAEEAAAFARLGIVVLTFDKRPDYDLSETALPFGAASGLFGEVDHDPLPVWRQVAQPVLAVWGELDREASPAESAPAIAAALAEGGNTSCTVAFLPGVRHNLGATFDDGFDRPDELPAAYGELEAAWVHGLADGPPSSSLPAFTAAGEASTPVEDPGGLNTPWVQTAA